MIKKNNRKKFVSWVYFPLIEVLSQSVIIAYLSPTKKNIIAKASQNVQHGLIEQKPAFLVALLTLNVFVFGIIPTDL